METNPYNSLYKHSTPKFIPLELIINHDKFDEWFNKNLSNETICNNVGRHALELAVEYIPNGILKIYCDDISKGKSPEEGRIYNEVFLGSYITIRIEIIWILGKIKKQDRISRWMRIYPKPRIKV